MALTEKQKLFVEEYLIDLNATQAAIRAGYSPKTAEQMGYQLLQKTSVANEIEKAKARRAKRLTVRQDDVIDELKAIAFARGSNYGKVVEQQVYVTTEDGMKIPLTDKDGNPIMYRTVQMELTDNLSEDEKKAITGIKMGKNGIEVGLADKVRALELLGKHLGMWKDKVEVSGLEDEKNKLDNILQQMRGDG